MRQYTEEMRRRSLYLAIFFTIAFITLAVITNKTSIAGSPADDEFQIKQISSSCTELPE